MLTRTGICVLLMCGVLSAAHSRAARAGSAQTCTIEVSASQRANAMPNTWGHRFVMREMLAPMDCEYALTRMEPPPSRASRIASSVYHGAKGVLRVGFSALRLLGEGMLTLVA